MEVRRKSDRVIAIVLTLGREVMRIYATKRKARRREGSFYDEMRSEWDLESSSEIIVFLGDFNGHVTKCAEGFKGVHGGMALGKEI